MSHFYGIVMGNARTKASRRGTVNSGLFTTAASWQGAVKVELYERDGTDYARVRLAPWGDKGTDRVLYDGPVSGSPA